MITTYHGTVPASGTGWVVITLGGGTNFATFDLDCFAGSGNPHQFSFQVFTSCGGAALTVVGPGANPVLESGFYLSSGTYYIGISTGDGSTGDYRLFISASTQATPTATPTATSDLNATSGFTTFNSGLYQFGNVHVYSGATVYVDGAVTFEVSGSFTVDAGATVIGDAGQFNGGPGSPAGESAGGSHAGTGGTSCAIAGGSTYDNPNNPFMMGSQGGGGGGSNDQGYGGSLFVLLDPTGTFTLNGILSVAGTTGIGNIGNGGGGGSGGSLNIKADTFAGSGHMDVSGGNGGGGGFGCGGSGGGGGMILINTHTAFTFSGTSNTNGGAFATGGGGSNGTVGTSGTFNTASF